MKLLENINELAFLKIATALGWIAASLDFILLALGKVPVLEFVVTLLLAIAISLTYGHLNSRDEEEG